MQALIFTGALFCVLNSALAFSNGSIEECCQTMVPPHGKQVDGVCPYSVSVENSDVSPGSVVPLKLTGPPFRGFIIQVRDEEDRIAGHFKIDPEQKSAHLLNCFGIPGSSISHNSRDLKTQITVYWISPEVPQKTYFIYSTIAVNKDEVWSKQPFGKIYVH